MRHGNLTREQIITIVGKEIVNKLDYVNCEPTSRLQTDGDTSTEWSASIRFDSAKDSCTKTLIAYYYTTPEQDQIMADNGGSSINWEINGYEIL